MAEAIAHLRKNAERIPTEAREDWRAALVLSGGELRGA